MEVTSKSERIECRHCKRMFRFNPDLVPRDEHDEPRCPTCLHVVNSMRARSHMEPIEFDEGAYLADTMQDQQDDNPDDYL